MTFTERTMMTSNHVVENMKPSITKTIIAQLLTKLTYTEQTNNLHCHFSPRDSMFLKQKKQTQCTKTVSGEKEEKPCDCHSAQLRCLVCEIIYHFVQNYPEIKSQDTSQETVLFETDYDHPDKLRNLVSESRNAAILDSGATNTVTDKLWINSYIDTLEEVEKVKFRCKESKNF